MRNKPNHNEMSVKPSKRRDSTKLNVSAGEKRSKVKARELPFGPVIDRTQVKPNSAGSKAEPKRPSGATEPANSVNAVGAEMVTTSANRLAAAPNGRALEAHHSVGEICGCTAEVGEDALTDNARPSAPDAASQTDNGVDGASASVIDEEVAGTGTQPAVYGVAEGGATTETVLEDDVADENLSEIDAAANARRQAGDGVVVEALSTDGATEVGGSAEAPTGKGNPSAADVASKIDDAASGDPVKEPASTDAKSELPVIGQPAASEAFAHDPASNDDTTAGNALPNGDESDYRMSEIVEILQHTLMSHLDKCEHYAEWIRLNEAKQSVLGQNVHKPQGGRPEGPIRKAARELPVPGKTAGARRKFLTRAIDIDSICSEAKAAVRVAKLDNEKSILFEIAREHALEAQLAKVKELAERKAAGWRKPNKVNPTPTPGEVSQPTDVVRDASEESGPADLPLNTDDDAILTTMRAAWINDRALRRDDWEKASAPLQRLFATDVLGLGRMASGSIATVRSLSDEVACAPQQAEASRGEIDEDDIIARMETQ
jgi:hypothetical protein